MVDEIDTSPTAPTHSTPLFAFNGGLLAQARTKRILKLSGYNVRFGTPGPDDLVGVWGNSPTAYRGEKIANFRGSRIVRIEDTWLRSLFPGRSGSDPTGMVIDHSGVHYDANTPSDLETLLATDPLDDTALLDRAREAILRLKEAHLTKYCAVDPQLRFPEPGYVLVIDQLRGDASLTASGADRNRFLEMLFVARSEHPGARILIKSHPETIQGYREGYFSNSDLQDDAQFFAEPASPWILLDGAIAVYTVSSQLGFEAIFAGHKPRVFGGPFYAGWGLTEDEFPIQRRQRKLSRAQLFAAAMILYPRWYDPFSDSLCPLETVIENLAAQARAWREDKDGWIASGMRHWKRSTLQRFFGSYHPVRFEDDPIKARADGKPWMVWASKPGNDLPDMLRIEDGFLRSRGLGAELTPPSSLVIDDLGIYYDASKPSRLEMLIAQSQQLRPHQLMRAEKLIRQIKNAGLSKYNQQGAHPELPKGHRILVVGQVEDDASLIHGGADVRTNLALLKRTREENPEAVLIYKPHPDVEAGLRAGAIDLESLADIFAHNADPAFLLGEVDEVWTMTSLLGFEALLRGVPVTTLGVPFYAGWELTRDLAHIPPRRRAQPSIEGLVHACLIDYPRYLHPDLQTPCPVEAMIRWLALPENTYQGSLANRLLMKLQGHFAGYSHLWR
ncbi:MAG: capsular polysaccharide biosynthesis protein [Roseobacter sp.]